MGLDLDRIVIAFQINKQSPTIEKPQLHLTVKCYTLPIYHVPYFVSKSLCLISMALSPIKRSPCLQ